MAGVSAGVLLYRESSQGLEILLVHPGGPYWRKRDVGAWQLPKGEIEAGERPDVAARREAEEELGLNLIGELLPLGEIRQAGGKRVHGFALAHDFDPAQLRSNMFEMEWPPRSGRVEHFPEIDAARWMTLSEAEAMILPSQRPLLSRLSELLRRASPGLP